ncbi:MAG: hypothetical protein AAB596_00170 [Patescibacteria group bacterium]
MDGQNSIQQSNQNTVLPPPQNEIKIRTMESDIEAVKLSGGDFSLTQAPISETQPMIAQATNSTNQQIFNATEKTSVLKTILTVIGIFLVALGAGFLTYYLVLKIL